AYSGELPSPNPFKHPPHVAVYKDQTLFVRAPARVGDIVGGTAGTIIGAPIGFVVGIFTIPKIGLIGIPLTTMYGGGIVGIGGRKIGSAITGAPFYILQKTFYDFPKWLFSGKENTDNIKTLKPAPILPSNDESTQLNNSSANGSGVGPR
ncbi:MAG: hypothetical protein KAS94_05230, partial [Desulfobulbaceae bacterium]|nr:hypothetical protein [Desulfobulbaceae bacterium]